MGPRSHERGNHLVLNPDTVARVSLQWGRVLMNAETSPSSMVSEFVPSLQWGRVLMNAETEHVNNFETLASCI